MSLRIASLVVGEQSFDWGGQIAGTVCKPYPELPIPWLRSRPGCELRWIWRPARIPKNETA